MKKLQQLKKLHESGLITDEEFAAQKNQIEEAARMAEKSEQGSLPPATPATKDLSAPQSTPVQPTASAEKPEDGSKSIQMVLIILFALFVASKILKGKEAAPPFGEENPIALEVSQVRSIFRANQLKDRLTDMGLQPEIVTVLDDNTDGQWHKVVVGTGTDLSDIRDTRQRIQEELNLEELTILQFEDIASQILTKESQGPGEMAEVIANRPDVSDDIYETIKRFPFSNVFRVERLTVYDSPADPADTGHHSNMLKQVWSDLPRGISRASAMRETDAFLEAILSDNLFGHRVTINVFKMRKNHSINGDLVDHYSQLVLDTGTYDIESLDPIEVGAGQKLVGNIVTIKTKKGVLRTYIILSNPTQEWVYFSQSTQMDTGEVSEVLTQIDQSEGLLAYPEFYNTFHTIQDRKQSSDTFLGLNLERLGNKYAQGKGYEDWAKRCVGHWAFEGYFRHEKKGSWSFGLFDLLTQESAQATYSMYSKRSQAKGLKPVQVYGSDGWQVNEQRRNQRTYRTYSWPIEINFVQGRYLSMVDNSKFGYLDNEGLLLRAHALQLEMAGGYAAHAQVP